MGQGPRYRMVLKRRRQYQTDYRKRKIMVLSKTPRLVIRSSLRGIQAQVVEALPQGDKTLLTLSSRQLNAYGWKAAGANVPASYLTGLVTGYRTRSLGITHVIPDIGLRRSSPGARVFAVVQGAIDSGLDVPCGEVFPGEARIQGKHIAAYAEALAATDLELYERRFSQYLAAGVKPDELPRHFEEVKANILNAFKEE